MQNKNDIIIYLTKLMGLNEMIHGNHLVNSDAKEAIPFRIGWAFRLESKLLLRLLAHPNIYSAFLFANTTLTFFGLVFYFLLVW